VSEMDQRLMNARVCKEFQTLMGIESHKVKWRVIWLENAMQSRWPIRHPHRMLL
jgi:hypothetical protein